MALDKDRLGNAITDALLAKYGNVENVPLMRDYWKCVADEVIKEFQENGDIEIQEGDLIDTAVSPAGTPPMKDSTNANITGLGTADIDATTLSQRIK